MKKEQLDVFSRNNTDYINRILEDQGVRINRHSDHILRSLINFVFNLLEDYKALDLEEFMDSSKWLNGLPEDLTLLEDYVTQNKSTGKQCIVDIIHNLIDGTLKPKEPYDKQKWEESLLTIKDGISKHKSIVR